MYAVRTAGFITGTTFSFRKGTSPYMIANMVAIENIYPKKKI